MALTPKLPPGRANRKALAYTAEIQRLRTLGYSFEAIRMALLEVGLDVSRTTIKREAAKRPVVLAAVLPPHAPLRSIPAPAAASTYPVPAETPPLDGSFIGDCRSGKEIAEAFMQGRITNPLMQERTSHESRSA